MNLVVELNRFVTAAAINRNHCRLVKLSRKLSDAPWIIMSTPITTVSVACTYVDTTTSENERICLFAMDYPASRMGCETRQIKAKALTATTSLLPSAYSPCPPMRTKMHDEKTAAKKRTSALVYYLSPSKK
jgi:hypothetical protein